MGPQFAGRWYSDRDAWRFIGLRYLPWLAGLSLAWELAQLPLYTLWGEGTPAFIAFSVLHCTLGDALIGAAAIILALIVARAPQTALWRWQRIALVTALLGAGYTGFSEWMNTVARQEWAYSAWMPVLRAFNVEIGISPIAQWLILPPIAIWLALTRAAVSGEKS